MKANDFCTIYTTVDTAEQAAHIARTLVEGKLVACANIFPEVQSIYRWAGELQESEEVVVLLKTKVSMRSEVMERLLDIHPYDCPCMVSYDFAEGFPGYLEWIAASVVDK